MIGSYMPNECPYWVSRGRDAAVASFNAAGDYDLNPPEGYNPYDFQSIAFWKLPGEARR